MDQQLLDRHSTWGAITIDRQGNMSCHGSTVLVIANKKNVDGSVSTKVNVVV